MYPSIPLSVTNASVNLLVSNGGFMLPGLIQAKESDNGERHIFKTKCSLNIEEIFKQTNDDCSYNQMSQRNDRFIKISRKYDVESVR